jgi:hypothetical protein
MRLLIEYLGLLVARTASIFYKAEENGLKCISLLLFSFNTHVGTYANLS